MSDEATRYYLPLMPDPDATAEDLLWQMAYDISEHERLFETVEEAQAENRHGGPIVKIVASIVRSDENVA